MGSSLQAPSDGERPGVKRALLIGINKYRSLPGLQGAVNDIETMRKILTTRWGFAEQNIATLVDEAATRSSILAALDRLVGTAGSDDVVYVHYSGHGSQVVDLNGDEVDDGLDETLVPHDGRTGNVRDITDDELNEIFSRLKAHVGFVVLDSCHSGTATRALDIRTRSVPKDVRLELYEQYERSKPLTRGAIVPTISSRYVVMTGAAAHQEALDGPVDGRYHGFFSFALSRSLGSVSIQASPREIFGGIEQEFKRIQAQLGRSSMPEPQLEAPRELLDKAVFGSSTLSIPGSNPTVPRLSWVEVQPHKAGHAVLKGGVLLGAMPGSSWSVYPPGELLFVPGRALAIARVVQIRGNDAVAQLFPADAAVKRGSRGVALLPASPGGTLPVRIMNARGNRRTQVEDMLRRVLPNIEFVGVEKTPKFLVDAEEDVLRLLSAEGLELVGLFRVDHVDWGARMALVMSRSVNASELLALANSSSQLKIDARVANENVERSSVTTDGQTVLAGNTGPPRYHIRRENEQRTVRNSLQLEVRVNADAYITVVDVDSEGNVNLLFPNDYQERSFYPDGFIRGGESVRLPDSLEPRNQAGFHWDYGRPAGADSLRVFASTDLQTAMVIRQRIQALQRPNKESAGTSPSVSLTLGSLRDDLAKVSLRKSGRSQRETARSSKSKPIHEEFPQVSAPKSSESRTESSAPLIRDDWASASIQILVTE